MDCGSAQKGRQAMIEKMTVEQFREMAGEELETGSMEVPSAMAATLAPTVLVCRRLEEDFGYELMNIWLNPYTTFLTAIKSIGDRDIGKVVYLTEDPEFDVRDYASTMMPVTWCTENSDIERLATDTFALNCCDAVDFEVVTMFPLEDEDDATAIGFRFATTHREEDDADD